MILSQQGGQRISERLRRNVRASDGQVIFGQLQIFKNFLFNYSQSVCGSARLVRYRLRRSRGSELRVLVIHLRSTRSQGGEAGAGFDLELSPGRNDMPGALAALAWPPISAPEAVKYASRQNCRCMSGEGEMGANISEEGCMMPFCSPDSPYLLLRGLDALALYGWRCEPVVTDSLPALS